MHQFNKLLTLITEWTLKVFMLIGLVGGLMTATVCLFGMASDDDFVIGFLCGISAVVASAMFGWAHAMLIQSREINEKLPAKEEKDPYDEATSPYYN